MSLPRIAWSVPQRHRFSDIPIRLDLPTLDFVLLVFFSNRRRHTIFDCDWSSDVCSSDLDSTTVDEIVELTEKIFKSRIISQEGPGRPEGQILPSEIFTVTRVTTKK